MGSSCHAASGAAAGYARRVRPTVRLAVKSSFYVFDILHLDGVDLTGQPYVERRAALEQLGLSRDGAVIVPQ